MRQKELRLALICYGGVSLAVYMHGITKEIWRLTRASRNFHANDPHVDNSQAIYRELLEELANEHRLKLRVLPDIIAGTSAGGINGIYLAQAIATGQSLEPLTDLWLDCADIDILLDPDARPFSRFTKFWAQPLVWLALSRPGGTVERTVAKETRNEVKTKLSRLIRARWFAPPFSGLGFSRLLYNAFDAMAAAEPGPKLLPNGQPLDLYVTVTDFFGHLERMRLNSPAEVVETEHRLTISFKAIRGKDASLGDAAELTFAARATASFPGAFPPFTVHEIDQLLASKEHGWPTRQKFLERIYPRQFATGEGEETVLIDGAVLTNAPFGQAMAALKKRPAHREIDRRVVYIDPKPDYYQPRQPMKKDSGAGKINTQQDRRKKRLPGFFSTIFGAISDIPREQPIRDNLEMIEARSNRVRRMRQITENLREDVEDVVGKLFGRTFFLDRPTPKRLSQWRNKAQAKAANLAGFTYAAYGQLKLNGIIEDIISSLRRAQPDTCSVLPFELREKFWDHLSTSGLTHLADAKGGATADAIAFFREHDLGFRIRRLRFLARRLGDDIANKSQAPHETIIAMHDVIYECLARYLAVESCGHDGNDFAAIAAVALENPKMALDHLGKARNLREIDALVDAELSEALEIMPKQERRILLLAYLGFPFYDIATLPLLQGEGMDEFDPIKVDRISPDDAQSIRKGRADATLRGIEFNSFGAFFSRSYRENDYLWGRLHGAERMIDLIASTVDSETKMPESRIRDYKKRMFLAILEEESTRLPRSKRLIKTIKEEVISAFSQG